MEQDKFHIDILTDYKDIFKTHLDIEDNYRTIFSGIFGIGKTTFLKDFFDLEESKKKYEIIHLFPVNYSIASNEDIFELIKFDIFYQLLEKNIAFELDTICIDKSAYQFIIENYTDILLPFLNFIPDVGGNIKELAEKFLELKKKFETAHEIAQTDELNDVNIFLNEFTKKKGTIYETDFYTELIINLVFKLKGEDKKVVLVIDDLDRIDPEHIFRLLNIFSAHADIKGNGTNYNKFNIDKVLIVCDIENIRNIFKTKFGIETDFNGYIDKFYTKSIFHYNISKILKSYSYKIRGRFRFKYYDNHDYLGFTNSGFFASNFTFILETLFEENAISLRDLNRVASQKDIRVIPYEINLGPSLRQYNTNFIITQLYDIFIVMFGNDKRKLFNVLSKVKYKNHYNRNIHSYIDSLVLCHIALESGINMSDDVPILSTTFKDAAVLIKNKYNTATNEYFTCEVSNFDVTSENFNYFKLLNSVFQLIDSR